MGLLTKAGLRPVTYSGNHALEDDFLTSDEPFYFVVDLPEGNYRVTVRLGDNGGASQTTVKAESRRLMLENIQTAVGAVEAHTFLVNVRRPQINAERRISLKPREESYLNWDDKLTLEFNGARPTPTSPASVLRSCRCCS